MKTIKKSNSRDYTGIIELTNGNKEWYLNGKLHREDGPAVENGLGARFWYVNGLRHREDGPAVEHADGYKEWHIKEVRLDKNKIQQLLDLGYPEKAAIKLTYYLKTNKKS